MSNTGNSRRELIERYAPMIGDAVYALAVTMKRADLNNGTLGSLVLTERAGIRARLVPNRVRGSMIATYHRDLSAPRYDLLTGETVIDWAMVFQDQLYENDRTQNRYRIAKDLLEAAGTPSAMLAVLERLRDEKVKLLAFIKYANEYPKERDGMMFLPNTRTASDKAAIAQLDGEIAYAALAGRR